MLFFSTAKKFLIFINFWVIGFLFIWNKEYSDDTFHLFYIFNDNPGLETSTYDFYSSPVDILLCSDKHDRYPMYTLIHSIIINEKSTNINRLRFHILVHDEIDLFTSEINKYFSAYSNRIHFEFASIVDSPQCLEYNEAASIAMLDNNEFRLNNHMNLARFCLPFIFENVSVAIYLDVDMLVHKQSISVLYDEYYHRHKDTYAAWSVINRMTKKIMRETFDHKSQMKFINRYLNRNLSTRYESVASQAIDFNTTNMFNGGILLFDLDRWRTYNFTEQSLALFQFDKIFEHKYRHRPWVGVTQPIYNLLFIINDLKVGAFPANLNFVIKDHFNYKCYEIQDPDNYTLQLNQSVSYIFHWAGGCKPWTVGPEYAPLAQLWTNYIPKGVDINEWNQQLNVTLV